LKNFVRKTLKSMKIITIYCGYSAHDRIREQAVEKPMEKYGAEHV